MTDDAWENVRVLASEVDWSFVGPSPFWQQEVIGWDGDTPIHRCPNVPMMFVGYPPTDT